MTDSAEPSRGAPLWPAFTGLWRLFERKEDPPWMYHALLVALFASFVVMPFEESLPFGNLIIRAVYTGIVLGALLMVSHVPVLLGVGAVLAFPSPVLRQLGLGTDTTIIVADAASLALMGFVIVVLMSRLLRHKEIKLDTISGMTAVYLLIGVAWTLLFGLIETVEPCSFNGVACLEGAPAATDLHPEALSRLFYYSFVTITTLGYGEVTPATEITQVAAAMEAVVGQLFLVVVLARMVGLMARPTAVQDR